MIEPPDAERHPDPDAVLSPLPDGLPEDLRDFLECRTASATIANGPIEWVQLPDAATSFLGGAKKPELTVRPGAAPDVAILDIKVGFLSVSLPASVADGKLSVDTSKLPFWAPGSVKTDVAAVVNGINQRLASHGMGLGSPVIGPDGLTLSKVPLTSTA